MKNDGFGSRLIELQSSLLSKFDVDPMTPCFDVSSAISACIVQDAVLSSRVFQDLCSLFIGFTSRKYCVLSSNSVLLIQSQIFKGM